MKPHDRPRGPLAQHFNQAGKPKRAFASRERAERDGFRPYECEVCGKWHRATAPGRKAKGAAMKAAPIANRDGAPLSRVTAASAGLVRTSSKLGKEGSAARKPLRANARPLPAMSAKAKARIPERQACVAEVEERDVSCVAAGRWPEVVCGGRLDTDEPLPRGRGGDPTDKDQAQLICRAHHDAKHANPKLAYERGLTIRGYAPTKKPILTSIDEHTFDVESRKSPGQRAMMGARTQPRTAQTDPGLLTTEPRRRAQGD